LRRPRSHNLYRRTTQGPPFVADSALPHCDAFCPPVSTFEPVTLHVQKSTGSPLQFPLHRPDKGILEVCNLLKQWRTRPDSNPEQFAQQFIGNVRPQANFKIAERAITNRSPEHGRTPLVPGDQPGRHGERGTGSRQLPRMKRTDIGFGEEPVLDRRPIQGTAEEACPLQFEFQ
jgi:hypothetical protein